MYEILFIIFIEDFEGKRLSKQNNKAEVESWGNAFIMHWKKLHIPKFWIKCKISFSCTWKIRIVSK